MKTNKCGIGMAWECWCAFLNADDMQIAFETFSRSHHEDNTNPVLFPPLVVGENGETAHGFLRVVDTGGKSEEDGSNLAYDHKDYKHHELPQRNSRDVSAALADRDPFHA